MKLWGIHFSRLRALFIALLFLVILTPWLVEWFHATRSFPWKRPVSGSLLLVVIVGVVLVSARRELLLRREAERRYKEFLDDAPLGTYTIDRNGCFTYVNHKLLEISGYSEEKLLGRPWREVVAPEDIPVVEQRIEQAYSGREKAPPPLEVRVWHRSGSLLHLLLHYTVLERAGRPEGILVVVQDVTRARKLEMQLVKSERLAVAGQLAMGLAHEINNPLAIIKTSLRLMKDRVIEGAELEETVQDIQEEVDRIAGMVRVLLGFREARPGEEPVTDVDEAVQSLLHLMGPQIKACRAETGFSWSGEKASAAIRPGHFRQIFFNLILNALDAMPGGGRLQLACRQENGRVCVRVEDTGCGIPLRDQARLFEPFFSTKSPHHHGLGLYVCYTLLKSVGGEIEVESRAGEGTAFTVRIPKAGD